MTRTRLIIEGWRFLPHSYAMVNQFQCLELLRRPEFNLFHRDAPWHPSWKPMRGLLDERDESAIAAIPPPPADAPDEQDVVLRMSFPHDCTPSPRARRVCVFVSAEQGVVPDDYVRGAAGVVDACGQPNLHWIVPSHWSRQGLIRSGAPPARVSVVPHGISPRLRTSRRSPSTQRCRSTSRPAAPPSSSMRRPARRRSPGSGCGTIGPTW